MLQFSAIISLMCAMSAVAIPLPPNSVSMAAAVPQWTIQSMKRTCNVADTKCTWTFIINTNDGNTTPCTYFTKGIPATEASDAKGGKCGAFTVTSGWSGQFGEGNGFTTLSVIDQGRKLIAWPAYTDNQLKNATVVSPNLSFAVQVLGG